MLDEQPVETTIYSLRNALPEPQDRRSGERHLSLLRVGSLTVDGRRELCLIRNVSAGGMLVRPYCRIAQGARLTIELKQGEPVSGTARWTKGECVGVEFDHPIDIIELLTATADGKRPRMPRVEISCAASVRQDGDAHRVRAVNISQGGLKIECAAGLEAGADVIVGLTGLEPMPGVVRWRDSET